MMWRALSARPYTLVHCDARGGADLRACAPPLRVTCDDAATALVEVRVYWVAAEEAGEAVEAGEAGEAAEEVEEAGEAGEAGSAEGSLEEEGSEEVVGSVEEEGSEGEAAAEPVSARLLAAAGGAGSAGLMHGGGGEVRGKGGGRSGGGDTGGGGAGRGGVLVGVATLRVADLEDTTESAAPHVMRLALRPPPDRGAGADSGELRVPELTAVHIAADCFVDCLIGIDAAAGGADLGCADVDSLIGVDAVADGADISDAAMDAVGGRAFQSFPFQLT